MTTTERITNIQRGIPVLFMSWFISGLAGAAYIFSFWNSDSIRGTGMIRTAIYITCLTILPVVAFFIYRRQCLPVESQSFVLQDARPTGNQIWRSLWTNGIVHFFVLLLASIVLDGGAMSRFLIPAVAGYWAGTALIVARRRKNPTRFDLQFLSIGTLLTIEIDVVLSVVIEAIRWHFG